MYYLLIGERFELYPTGQAEVKILKNKKEADSLASSYNTYGSKFIDFAIYKVPNSFKITNVTLGTSDKSVFNFLKKMVSKNGGTLYKKKTR
jgi:hypothetical protein